MSVTESSDCPNYVQTTFADNSNIFLRPLEDHSWLTSLRIHRCSYINNIICVMQVEKSKVKWRMETDRASLNERIHIEWNNRFGSGH